jgi:hypothetical protein
MPGTLDSLRMTTKNGRQLEKVDPSFALDFVNRRKLNFVTREKRILLVAFSRRKVTFAGRQDDNAKPKADSSSS